MVWTIISCWRSRLKHDPAFQAAWQIRETGVPKDVNSGRLLRLPNSNSCSTIKLNSLEHLLYIAQCPSLVATEFYTDHRQLTFNDPEPLGCSRISCTYLSKAPKKQQFVASAAYYYDDRRGVRNSLRFQQISPSVMIHERSCHLTESHSASFFWWYADICAKL